MTDDTTVDVEALAAAIDAADRGYSIELVSLTKAGRIEDEASDADPDAKRGLVVEAYQTGAIGR